MKDPNDDCEDACYELQSAQRELYEELAEFNDSWAASNEDGWFYSDDD